MVRYHWSDVLQYVDTLYISKWLFNRPHFPWMCRGSEKDVCSDLYLMHVFRGFPEDHLFFHVHSAGHPITARYIFVWLDSFWSAALLMFPSQLECWARFPVIRMYFQGFGCDHWSLSPLPTNKCFYPLDGFVCIFRYPTMCLRKPKQSCPHLKVQPRCSLV